MEGVIVNLTKSIYELFSCCCNFKIEAYKFITTHLMWTISHNIVSSWNSFSVAFIYGLMGQFNNYLQIACLWESI